ncbi:MAG: UDP-N-acetylmuramoyl-L-alanyl-D-glutamate--2,6-diaminopimelate ligase [Actinomycetota bacterium]
MSRSATATAVDRLALECSDLLVGIEGTTTAAVTGVSCDSRDVRTGDLFCCVPGSRYDGHDFAVGAVAAGAGALLVDRHLPAVDARVPQIVVRDVRLAMGRLAAAIWGPPSTRLQLVGVTGTNGKTTTTALIGSIMRAAGWATEVMGTLTGRFTTPEAPVLQESLADCVERGVKGVAMEVSSHALQLHRVDGTRFAAGVFTNLSRDHLDLHGTMDAYFEAKARLFDSNFTDIAVVNVDDVYGERLAAGCRVKVVPFGRADLTELSITAESHSYAWRGLSIRVPLGGSFNVSNSLAAATVAREIGIDPAAVVEGLATAPPVPGRFESVDEGQDFTVLVDYAHTPDGLASVLRSVRDANPSGRVIVVFGCGGDRDKAKRPLMGEIAATLADEVVVTSDNPRSEDLKSINAAIVAGIPDHLRHRLVGVNVDRADAIQLGIGRASVGDVVVIAGKGHETTQTFGTTVEPFDDRVVAREALRGRA